MSQSHMVSCNALSEGNWFSIKKTNHAEIYGTYFHNITSHAPIQNRLINGRSANTEEQERIFNAITNITRTTSSFHPDHIISNIMVRLQAEKDFSMNHHDTSCVEKQQARVSSLASSLPEFPNTIIPRDMLVNHPSSWQAHLGRISDFLAVGKGVWWNETHDGNIEFFDSKGNPEFLESGSLLHHFRSSSFKSEECYLKECWAKCLEQKSDLPILMQVEDENGNMVIQHGQTTHVVACEDTYSLTKEADNGNLAGDVVVSDDEHIGDVLGDRDISFDHVSDNAKFVDNPDDVTSKTTDSSEKAKYNAEENHEVVTRADLTEKHGIHHYI